MKSDSIAFLVAIMISQEGVRQHPDLVVFLFIQVPVHYHTLHTVEPFQSLSEAIRIQRKGGRKGKGEGRKVQKGGDSLPCDCSHGLCR